MAIGAKNSGITPFFKSMPFKNERKSIEAGRPIFEDFEVVEIRFAGSKDFGVYRVHDFSHWEVDEETGENVRLTYAERWPKQYQQFKLREQQTKSGTPLDYVPFLTPAKRSELRALNIYTLEALADLDGQPLKNLGVGGRELKNKAMEYLASSSHDGIILKQQAQIDALINQIRLMEDDKKMLLAGPMEPPPKPPEPGPDRIPTPPEDEDEDEPEDDGNGEDERTVAAGMGTPPEFVGMNKEQLRAFIIEKTGKRPVGTPSTKNLVRIAQEISR